MYIQSKWLEVLFLLYEPSNKLHVPKLDSVLNKWLIKILTQDDFYFNCTYGSLKHLASFEMVRVSLNSETIHSVWI